MAMENTLFIVVADFPIESPISNGFPIAKFDYRRVPVTSQQLTIVFGFVSKLHNFIIDQLGGQSSVETSI